MHVSGPFEQLICTGKSIFFKIGAPEVDPAAELPAGAPIVPDSVEAMHASLLGLRTELARAQRADPRMAGIIAKLRKEPLGSFISEPRGPEGRKFKVRALKYRLASDGVLVARQEDDLSCF